jgi:hypothetical protein
MAFVFSERYITEYYRDGYTIFREILPPSLIQDLRHAADAGRVIAREAHGPQAQRLQPIANYVERLETRPFREYLELPELLDAIRRVLSPEHYLSGFDILAVLYEPAERPWCTFWHRDISERSPCVDPQEMRLLIQDPLFFVQISCALYTDASLWYVPASHGRPDTEGEATAARHRPALDDMTAAEAERRCIECCRAMPGAVQTLLEPGDFMFYRTNAWHLGNYAPYRKRATLHGYIWSPEAERWYRAWKKKRAQQANQSQEVTRG